MRDSFVAGRSAAADSFFKSPFLFYIQYTLQKLNQFITNQSNAGAV